MPSSSLALLDGSPFLFCACMRSTLVVQGPFSGRLAGAACCMMVLAVIVGKVMHAPTVSSAKPQLVGGIGEARTIMQQDVSFARISLERREGLPGLPLHRLVVVARQNKASDSDVHAALDTIHSILGRRVALTAHYDIRDAGMVLSRSQLWHGIAWVRKRENAQLMDANLQCISLTMKPGIVRATVSFFVHVTAPPQPIHIGTDEASALQFARERCRERRDWSAASAARDLSGSHTQVDATAGAAHTPGMSQPAPSNERKRKTFRFPLSRLWAAVRP